MTSPGVEPDTLAAMTTNTLQSAFESCFPFDNLSAETLEHWLSAEEKRIETRLIEPDEARPFIEAGRRCTHVFVVRVGEVIPWSYPPSRLRAPFLVGQHELLMSPRRREWQTRYSVLSPGVVLAIPIPSMDRLFRLRPQLEPLIRARVLRRLTRFYWTSLATSGPMSSRVAAAILSRIALWELPIKGVVNVDLPQTELVRLTVASRPSVASGLSDLEKRGVIKVEGQRYTGTIQVTDVSKLIDVLSEGPIGRLVRTRLDEAANDRITR